MPAIRAAQIGTYLYCKRAWKYDLKGEISENKGKMASGTAMHKRHGRAALQAGCMRAVAFGLMLLALAVLAFYLTRSLF